MFKEGCLIFVCFFYAVMDLSAQKVDINENKNSQVANVIVTNDLAIQLQQVSLELTKEL